jgi:branched-chain amino acid aminotransferase
MQVDGARIRVPFPESRERFEESLLRLVEANRAVDATLRVYVARNRGGMFEGPGQTRGFDVVAFTRDVHGWGEAARLGLEREARHAGSEFAGTKYLSWAENLTRYERAQERGLDEVVLLNERGEVAECTSANIFAVRNNRVRTPPITSGCLPGVTRAVLLEEIRVAGIAVEEAVLGPRDLEAADEVFITSTTRELLPVASIEGLTIRTGRSVRDQLQHAFSDYVAAYTHQRLKPEILHNR